MDVNQLVIRCKNNELLAQEQLYKLYSSKMFAIALKYSKNYAEAQDNLQDAFLVVFDKIKLFDFKGSFEGWLKRVIINHILQQYRKSVVFEVIKDNFTEDIDVAVDVDESVNLDYLLKIIQELPDRYRLVFNLYVLDEYSHKEIATMLGISEGTSKSNLARAKMILKNKLTDADLKNYEISL